MASPEIDALSQALARLPGLGPRSARRAVLHLLKRRETALSPLVRALQAVEANMSTCHVCGNVDTRDPCGICTDPRRDSSQLCVVEEVILAMNATLEGQTTMHYVADRLENMAVKVTQLAHGVPVGGELDYLDEGTLAQALKARRPVA